MKKSIYTFLLLPFAAAAIGCLMLFLVSLIPETAIHENSLKSAEEMIAMGDRTAALPSSDDFSFYYDNHTDRLIVMESYTLSSKEPLSVLLNPYFSSPSAKNLTKLINREVDTNLDYFRYWQGFRVFIRPLLVVSSYFGILEISAIVFFFLFGLTICAITAKYGKMAASMFCLSVAIFKPAVIAFSLQYVCCFLLMFIFSIIVLTKKISVSKAPAIFCIFGMATQFFDFYTTPPITYAIPVLFLLMDEAYRDTRWSTVLRTSASWMYGYVSIWLVKLAVVSLIPGYNGFEDGFSSLKYRLGTSTDLSFGIFANIKKALINVWWMSCPGENELLIFAALLIMVVVAALVLLKCKGVAALVSCGAFLAVAIIPVIWTMIAAQPMNIHAWFQHRILLPLYAGVFLFFVQAMRECSQKMDCHISVAIK